MLEEELIFLSFVKVYFAFNLKKQGGMDEMTETRFVEIICYFLNK